MIRRLRSCFDLTQLYANLCGTFGKHFPEQIVAHKM